ncbi:MAG TPA: hypothetical protein VGG76_06580 [Gemmatimonadaceae bacterium]
MLPFRRHLASLGFLIALLGISACSLNTDIVAVGQVSTSTGDNQSAPANTLFPTPLSVLVVSQLGEPMEQVTVNWSIASGGGSLSTNVSLTDTNGIASVSYTAGPTPGHAVIVAQVHGVEPLSFDETIT